MAIRSDPDRNEIRALLELADLGGKHVLEIGSGDGRLTWRYADAAAHVTAIEPFEDSFKRAKARLSNASRDHIEFHNIAFEDFASTSESAEYDIAILSWSLC